MKVTMKTARTKVLQNQLKRYRENSIRTLRRHTVAEAEGIMTAAKKLCPVKTGTLRATGNAIHKPTPNGVRTVLGFGGASAGYALLVHETHPTQSKFLEAPFKQAMKGYEKRLVKAIVQANRGLK